MSEGIPSIKLDGAGDTAGAGGDGFGNTTSGDGFGDTATDTATTTATTSAGVGGDGFDTTYVIVTDEDEADILI
jgi:hypothetical protein